MGSYSLRQGPQQRRPAGISWRSTLLGLVLGVVLLGAAPGAASAAADLAITGHSGSPDPVPVEGVLTYTITIQNLGPDPATAVSFSDDLALSPSSVTSTKGTCDLATVTCNVDIIEPLETVTITITATVGPETPSPITNAATVFSPDDTFAEDPDNDYSEVVTTVTPFSDLALAMTDVPDPLLAGELLTYAFEVHNRGPSTATGIRVTDTLPSGVSFVQAGPNCSEAAGVVTCEVGTLASGDRARPSITVRASAAGTIANEAQVSSGVADPNPDNNMAAAETTVTAPPSPVAPSDAGPKTGPLQVVLTGSYVLISGRSVKLVKGRFVPVKLTCAGQRKCEGTITITTANPVKSTKKPRKGKKRKRRIARLGSKKFAIEGNRQQRVLVPLGKGKVKLLKRLKRVKAKAAIREIDVKGNPRISTRTFMLRAR
jgi:uncharacterized repeat protein (TIGR01451 family)